MTGFKLGSVSLGKTTKKYSRNTDFDNNTTMDFGFCQPLFCQFMLPDSDISVSAKQLVRLAPMPVPSFARVSLVNKYIFVPFADICPYYEAMLSNMPYNGSVIPKTLPYTYNSNLAAYLLSSAVGSVCTIYEVDTSVTSPITYKQVTFNVAQSVATSVAERLGQNPVDDSVALSLDITPLQTPTGVGINSADYVLEISVDTNNYLIAFRYSQMAKHLRAIFIGLGYSLALTDFNKVNALPILAYYKSWFDTFAPQRSMAWSDTKVFKFIKDYSDNYKPSVTHDTFFSDVIKELANTYYVSNDDYVSVHRSSMSNLTDVPSLRYNDSSGISHDVSVTSGNLPSLSLVPPKLSLIQLDVIKRLTRFVNKDSIIGQKMSNWVRNHFNAEVANSLYKDVYQIKTDILPLQINDVFSTSDTADASTKQGERLGAYAGKGIGFGDSGCKFHADKHGYLLCISAIVPKSGYFQGTDTSLYGLDRYTLPSADFDALGMEVTPFGFVAGDIGYSDQVNTQNVIDYTSGFGFVPRFSGYKFKKNIVNGDMSRRGMLDQMSPYYLDRILQSGDIFTEKNDNGTYALIRSFAPSIPKASEQWRYLTRYPWLGDFDRIFYNDDVYHGSYSTPSNSDPETLSARSDNFIVQSLFTMRINDVLKPLSMSYDTFDEQTDNTSTDVTPE